MWTFMLSQAEGAYMASLAGVTESGSKGRREPSRFTPPRYASPVRRCFSIHSKPLRARASASGSPVAR
jgi:hypothetical protein